MCFSLKFPSNMSRNFNRWTWTSTCEDMKTPLQRVWREKPVHTFIFLAIARAIHMTLLVAHRIVAPNFSQSRVSTCPSFSLRLRQPFGVSCCSAVSVCRFALARSVAAAENHRPRRRDSPTAFIVPSCPLLPAPVFVRVRVTLMIDGPSVCVYLFNDFLSLLHCCGTHLWRIEQFLLFIF